LEALVELRRKNIKMITRISIRSSTHIFQKEPVFLKICREYTPKNIENCWSTTERTKKDQIKSENVKSFRGVVKCELVRLAVKQIELSE
jgi:hypothetical protein